MTVTHDNLLLQARDVHFDTSEVPLHWIPNEPFATHMLNVTHLMLPAGERWFVDIYKEALPLITDDRLRDDVIGFIGQEAMHATAHDGALSYLRRNGIDPKPFTDRLEWFFQAGLGDRGLTGRRRQNWLVERLALIAAIEHLTFFLGQWVLDARGFEKHGADADMVGLLRWHGAEEVEHRSVAFDVFQHVDGRYGRRIRAQLIVMPMLAYLWNLGVRFLLAHDPLLEPSHKEGVRSVSRAAKKDLLPGYWRLARSSSRYFRPSFHPSQEGSTDAAVTYLATAVPVQHATERLGAVVR
jgi:predicted metal-dependent hydrolase